MMQRDWVKEFYKECGRELTLAYNTVNQTNTWGVSIVGAILATGLLGAANIDKTTGVVTFGYPNLLHWYLIIVAWIVMLRFFVRSALGLANMWRWNELIYSSAKVLSLPDGDPSLAVFQRNLAKKVDAYYFKWKIPIRHWPLIVNNLKLMYFWFLLALLGLFAWGAISLPHDTSYFLGLALFAVPTLVEAYWFQTYYGLQYEDVHPEHEPDLQTSWNPNQIPGSNLNQIVVKQSHVTIDKSRSITFGFCTDGPYKHAQSILSNKQVSWLPWTYHEGNIHPSLLNDLKNGLSLSDRRLAFACWDSSFTGEVKPIRWGRVDHFVFGEGTLRATILLDTEMEGDIATIKVSDPRVLCFYLPERSNASSSVPLASS